MCAARKCVGKYTDGSQANAPMLKRQIKTLISRQEAQDLPRIEEAGFATTDTFKVPDENNTVGGGQDYEIVTIPGYMCYRKKISHPIVVPNM